MDLLSLCLRIPNLGILIFYLIFVIIIPYVLMASNSNDMLKYYMPLLVAFANLLTLAGDKRVFGNLYQLQPNNFVAFISTNFINLFALFGILWQCLEHSRIYNIDITRSVIYGTILFVIAFPMARQGMVFILTHVDKYLRETTELKYNYNWHLMTFGLLYIVFLLGLQAILLSLIDFDDDRNNSKERNNNERNSNKINNILNNLSKKSAVNTPPIVAHKIPIPSEKPKVVSEKPTAAPNKSINKKTKDILNQISLSNIKSVLKSSKQITSKTTSKTSSSKTSTSKTSSSK